MQRHPDAGARMTAQSDFIATVRPCFEAFVAEGLIAAWGLTGIGHPDAIIELLADRPAPAVVQCIANAMDSPGALKFYDEPARPREVIAAAQANGVGVMGIRAVQAGALTDAIDRDLPPDHGEVRDYNRAGAYRALAAELGLSAATLGHRYALSMAGVDTVVLGVKNRAELAECVAAAEAGPLPDDIMARVDGCFTGNTN
jgi:aryl-alcohol dehydrogenase-like predicted oxidoreductase